VVRGDSSTQYQKIMAVVTMLGKNGITKIGLATQPNK
jgi:biopolymer transport protein ExbD